MEILAVTVPFQPFVERLVRRPFGERFADAQAAGRGVALTLLLVETADPALARIFFGEAPQRT